MSIIITQSLPELDWRRFVDQHPQGNVFHTPEMFRVFDHAAGCRSDLWAAIQDGQVLALLLPVHLTLMTGLLRYVTTRSVAYGSVLSAPGREGQEALARLLQAYREGVKGAPLFTELRNLSDLNAVQPTLRQQGFVYEDHLNYLVDLDRAPEVILQSLGRRTRKNIRRGLRQGKVTIEEVKERETVAAFYDLLWQTYKSAQVPLADRSLFEAAFDLLYPKGMVRFTLARVDQTPAAVSIELLYKDVVYGWYGGVDRAYNSYLVNELLHWHILEWGATNGYRVYDFGGAGSPSEEYGVREFKAKFGGELVCFGRNTCIHSPRRFRLSELGYSLLRRFL